MESMKGQRKWAWENPGLNFTGVLLYQTCAWSYSETTRYQVICYCFQQMIERQSGLSEEAQRHNWSVFHMPSICRLYERPAACYLLPAGLFQQWRPLGREATCHRELGLEAPFHGRAISLFITPNPIYRTKEKNRKKLPTSSRREDKPKPQNTRQDSATSHCGLWPTLLVFGCSVTETETEDDLAGLWMRAQCSKGTSHQQEIECSTPACQRTHARTGKTLPTDCEADTPSAHSWARAIRKHPCSFQSQQILGRSKKTPTLAFGM